MSLDLRNMDCMELMAEFPDKHFELAIVDPPYNVGASDGNFGRRSNNKPYIKNGKVYSPTPPRNELKHYANHNKTPDKNYFDELFRVSKNQIIWGSNYYPEFLNHSGAIVWDKRNTGPLSDGEIAYQSINKLVRIFVLQWSGFIKDDGNNSVKTIHPNQKPVRLYKWLLENYAKPGDKILDTHAGSFSIAVACDIMGFDLWASEIDKDYYEAGIKRVKEETAQLSFL